MANHDVRDLLTKLASDAPELRGVMGYQLRRRIARRRKASAIGSGALAGVGVVGLVIGLASLANTGESPGVGQPAGGDGRSTDRPAAGRTRTPLGCGSTLDIQPAEKPMKLTVAGPVRLSPDGHGLAQVKITLVNASGNDLEGTSAASPSAVLARDGIVVAESADIPGSGRNVKLNPGQTLEFSAASNVKTCDTGAGPGRGLEPGEYQLFATLGFQYRDTDGVGVGESIEISGGPWGATLN